MVQLKLYLGEKVILVEMWKMDLIGVRVVIEKINQR